MVHVIKVYFEEQKNAKQIRRLAVNSEVVGKFDLLVRKIREIFPMLANKKLEVTWRDSENDVIHMSSDDELAQALANAEEGLLRIYVYTSDGPQPVFEEIPRAKSSHNEIHPDVVCDNCDKSICGYRYKCLQCRNYDLCSACNAADNHRDHDMIKLVKPNYIPREWVYLGSRKLWRSMFGRCPSAFFQNYCQQKKEGTIPKSPEAEKPSNERSQWHTVVNDLLKGDFVPAEKILKENLGNFLNFVENVAGGVDVKIENCPFNGSSQATYEAGKNFNQNTEETVSPTEQHTPSTPPKENVISEKEHVEPTAEKEVTKMDKSIPAATVTHEASSCTSAMAEATNFEASSTNADKVADHQLKEPSPVPCGLFCEIESSTGAEGWTLVHDHDAEEKLASATSSVESGSKPKKQVIYPDITETIQSCEVPQELLNAAIPCEVSKPSITVTATQAPEIMNALEMMQAMGFTNEGGWLERLLITKDGNINAALDALYPGTRRQ